MGTLNSHEDINVPAMLSRFTGPEVIQADNPFWEKFLTIQFQQYLKKSSHASYMLNEYEIKLRRNFKTSQNLRTFINLMSHKLESPCVTLNSMTEIANGLCILRAFLFRFLACPSEAISHLEGFSHDNSSPWHRHLNALGLSELFRNLIQALSDYSVDRKEVYNFEAECASTLLSGFLVPFSETDFNEPLFAYTCLLAIQPGTASHLVRDLLNYYIRESLSHPSQGMTLDDISDISWVDFIDAYEGYDRLGDTSLWILLLLAHLPDKSEGDMYSRALASLTDEESCNSQRIEELIGNSDSTRIENEPKQCRPMDGIITDDKELVNRNKGNNSSFQIYGDLLRISSEVGDRVKKTETISEIDICSNGKNSSIFGLRKRADSLPSLLDGPLSDRCVNENPNSKYLSASTANADDLCTGRWKEMCPKINFSDLFTAVSCSIDKEGTILLVYTLILRNDNAKKYFQAREQIDLLVYTLTKKLYVAEGFINSYSTYLCLCIILMLSEDRNFCYRLHDYTTTETTWYRETILTNVSLGSLIVIVLCRLLNRNISKLMDDFINENVLAIMSNMATTFRNLHPYACHQLVTTFEALGRRYLRLQSGDGREAELSGSKTNNTIDILKEIMLSLLQIMDACIVVHLPENPNLVYSLLHKSTMFLRFMDIGDFQGSLENLALVWKFYSDRLCKRKGQLSEEDIFEEIKECSDPFPYHLLRAADDMKFRYIEDKNCPGFFLPFVSHIISKGTKLEFNEDLLPA